MNICAADPGFEQSVFQGTPGVVKHFVGGAAGGAQQGDDLVERHLLEFPENGGALLRREVLGDRSPQDRDETRPVFSQGIVRQHGGLSQPSPLLDERIQRNILPALAAEFGKSRIQRNALSPGGELAAPLKLVESFQDAEESILRKVLDVGVAHVFSSAERNMQALDEDLAKCTDRGCLCLAIRAAQGIRPVDVGFGHGNPDSLSTVRVDRDLVDCSRGFKLWSNRKIDHCSDRVVEVVREDVERGIRDDFHDIAIGETEIAQAGDIFICDVTAVIRDLFGEGESGFDLRVGGFRAACCEDLVTVEAGFLSEQAVSGDAVVAGVCLADDQRDLLAEFRRKRALRERAVEREVGTGCGG